MKFNPKIVFPLLLVYGLILSASSLAQQDNSGSDSHFAVAYSGCMEVKRAELTLAQTEQWRKINDIESQMRNIHEPLKSVEQKASSIGKQIQSMVKEAVSENDSHLVIDMHMIAKHVDTASDISELINSHSKEFEQLETLGAKIGNLANAFNASLKSEFDGFTYDYMQIISSDSHRNLSKYCDLNEKLM